MKKKVLFFQWDAFMQDCTEKAMQRLGIEYECLYYPINLDTWDDDKTLAGMLDEKLSAGEFDTLFSINFCPVLADAALKYHVHYISWVYDSPICLLRTETLKYPCNDIYFFDRADSESMLADGVTGAHHLMLAADPYKFSDEGIAKTKELRKAGKLRGNVYDDMPDSWYECDVAFLGQLYKSKFAYLCAPLDEYCRGYLEGIVRAQQALPGGYIIDDMLDDKILDRINEQIRKVEVNGSSVSKRQVAYAIGTEVTGRERLTTLALLQSRCRVNLYSRDTDDRLGQVAFKGTVDYDTVMPEIFKNCKINLNMSLCMIRTGIPLRVLDILACGGFLITDYQEEIAENFVSGRDLVIYEDYVDLVEKVKYYLAHDDERRQIAQNGYNRVKEMFTFDDRVKVMFADRLLKE